MYQKSIEININSEVKLAQGWIKPSSPPIDSWVSSAPVAERI